MNMTQAGEKMSVTCVLISLLHFLTRFSQIIGKTILGSATRHLLYKTWNMYVICTSVSRAHGIRSGSRRSFGFGLGQRVVVGFGIIKNPQCYNSEHHAQVKICGSSPEDGDVNGSEKFLNVT